MNIINKNAHNKENDKIENLNFKTEKKKNIDNKIVMKKMIKYGLKYQQNKLKNSLQEALKEIIIKSGYFIK